MIKTVLFLVTLGCSYYTQRENAKRQASGRAHLDKLKADSRAKFAEGPQMHWTIHDYLKSPSCAESNGLSKRHPTVIDLKKWG